MTCGGRYEPRALSGRRRCCKRERTGGCHKQEEEEGQEEDRGQISVIMSERTAEGRGQGKREH